MQTSLKPGFTLAELLIALALLGIIAAFTIPKVLQATAEQQRVALLRETAATLESAWYTNRSTNVLKTYTHPVAGDIVTLGSAIEDNLNTTRREVPAILGGSGASVFDPGHSLAGLMDEHPCYNPPHPWMLSANGYMEFPNGVVVTNVDGLMYPLEEVLPPAKVIYNTMVCIDINNKAPPNQLGQDVFLGLFNPWGDFDVSGGDTTYMAGDNRKAFLWGGNETDRMRLYFGEVIGAPYDEPEASVGYWLTR